MYKKLLIVIPLLLLTGCATQKYVWNGYDDSLYAYYKHPENKQKYIQKLQEIITKAEQSHTKVPPGIYAEYGYMFYEGNNYSQAIVYFTKEHDLWPESAVFMEKMIRDSKAMTDKTKPKGS
jgi:hypothetical protein